MMTGNGDFKTHSRSPTNTFSHRCTSSTQHTHGWWHIYTTQHMCYSRKPLRDMWSCVTRMSACPMITCTFATNYLFFFFFSFLLQYLTLLLGMRVFVGAKAYKAKADVIQNETPDKRHRSVSETLSLAASIWIAHKVSSADIVISWWSKRIEYRRQSVATPCAITNQI